MNDNPSQWLEVGRISGVHGVKGWVKIHSYTSPPEKIVQYRPWFIRRAGITKPVEVVDSKINGKAVIVSLPDVTDRDQALTYVDSDIVVETGQLPALDDGEYYWHQLEGLRVVSQFEGQEYDLGLVKKLLETGSNDVLVVQGDENSVDRKERLLPYLRGSTVVEIDLDQQKIIVDWDPAF